MDYALILMLLLALRIAVVHLDPGIYAATQSMLGILHALISPAGRAKWGLIADWHLVDDQR